MPVGTLQENLPMQTMFAYAQVSGSRNVITPVLQETVIRFLKLGVDRTTGPARLSKTDLTN